MFLRYVCALLCFVLPLAAQHGPAPAQPHFTVQEALSAPFMNQLTAAPAKARVAWFVDQEGKRNVWVASPAEAAHSITHYTEDDGQDIDDITWAPDAEAVAYTHGTGPEGSEHPFAANPAHLQRDVEQQVEVATVGGVVRIIGQGHSPLFSADGKELYFIRHGQVWFASADFSKAAGSESASPPSEISHPERSTAESKDLLSSAAATNVRRAPLNNSSTRTAAPRNCASPLTVQD